MMVLAGSLALVVFYKCSVLLLVLLGLLRPHVPPMNDDDDALKSMAFTAQISYSHEKQFRVIPIIIIIIIICFVVDLILVSSCRMYEKNIYREFISFLVEPWFGLGIGGNQGEVGQEDRRRRSVTRHRSRDLSRQHHHQQFDLSVAAAVRSGQSGVVVSSRMLKDADETCRRRTHQRCVSLTVCRLWRATHPSWVELNVS